MKAERISSINMRWKSSLKITSQVWAAYRKTTTSGMPEEINSTPSTQYWNEVLLPKERLDPDLVKALIATESAFNPHAGIKPRPKKAKGLMQLTRQTTQALRDQKGELKDHFVVLSKADIENPNLIICAGIRWLFRKQRTATSKFGREATWDEAIADYKSYFKDLDNPQMLKLRKLYQKLKK